MTEEDDTAEDVSRNADAEDQRVEVADKDVLCGDECLKGDDVVGVVPRNKAVYVTEIDAMVCLNFHC